MREKARIERILSLIERIWQQQPDVRFNQLISNLQSMYSSKNNGYGKRKITEKWESGDVETSYLDFFYLEDTEWEPFLESLIQKEETAKERTKDLKTATGCVNDFEVNAITVAKFILAGKTVEEITETTGLSTKYIENVKKDLLKGANLEQLMKQYASYNERILYDAGPVDSQFNTATSHEKCSHFYIEDNDVERLSALNLINNKLYELHYNSEEDDYYVVNENGEHCYSIDSIVHVKMLKRVE